MKTYRKLGESNENDQSESNENTKQRKITKNKLRIASRQREEKRVNKEED